MKDTPLENRIKELELELNTLKASVFAEQKTLETDVRFRNFIELSIFPILILKGVDMILEIANEPLLKIFNVGKEALGKPFLEVLPEMKDQPFIGFLLDVLHNHTTHYGNEQPAYFVRENGEKEILFFNFVYHPYKENNGVVSGVIVYATDVTELVLACKKAEESEFRFHNLVYTSPYMIAIFKGKETFIEIANDAIIETWGKGKDIIGKSLFEVLPEAAEQGFDKIIKAVYETGEPFHAYETPVTLIRNGVQQLMHYNFIYQAQRNKHGEIEGVAILANEVTPQALVKKALAAQLDIEHKALMRIEESNKRYHTMLMQSPFAFSIMKGKDMVVTLANDLMKQFWGKGMEVEGKTLLEILPELKDQPFPEMIYSVFITGQPIYANEILAHLTYNEKLEAKYFNIVYQPHYEADNSISGVSTIAYEVTEMVLARKKIEESEYKYHNLVYTSPYMIAIFKGKESIIEIANDAIIETWGKGKDIIGKSLFEVLPEAAEQGFDKIIQAVYETGEPFHAYETPVTLVRNGKQQLMHYNFIYQAQQNKHGEIEGVAILANEVTPQVEAKIKIIESEERFRSLADNIPLSVFIIEPTDEANISYFNKYWLDYTKQTLEEAIGKGWEGIVHADDVQTIMDVYVPAFAARQPYNLAGIRIKRHDGMYRWFAVQANPRYLPNGAFMGYIGVGFDVHEQKLLEIALTDAKLVAENAVKFKQQFLSNISHEIRTPLNSILGFANVLIKTELSQQQKDFVDAIKTSGNSLHLLINDILDLAKVDAGKMTFENQPFDMHKKMRTILHSFDLKIKEKNIQLENDYDIAIPHMVIGDSLRLNQIILNLMSNAIKFTHKGKITLNVKLQSEKEKEVLIEFTINDTGIGIAADKLNSIFNLFEQAEINTSNSYGGTGLGLAIVKQLVEAQGGNINVNSKIGEGSTFSFVLPFGKTDTSKIEEVETLKLDSKIKNLRILVAEDVALNQLLIKIILTDFGFAYDVVDNGKLAIEKLQTNSYDIILMDLQMPEINGFEATEYIRKTMKNNIPIIALTADVTTVDVDKCKVFGMDDYISKPINENQLYGKIIEVMKRKGIRQKL